jgi:hypothetical protein
VLVPKIALVHYCASCTAIVNFNCWNIHAVGHNWGKFQASLGVPFMMDGTCSEKYRFFEQRMGFLMRSFFVKMVKIGTFEGEP